MYKIPKKFKHPNVKLYLIVTYEIEVYFCFGCGVLKVTFFQVAAVTLKPWMQLEESGVNSTPTTLCRVEELYIV